MFAPMLIMLFCHFFCIVTFLPFYLQVLIGGGQNHRMGLFDMVLIKDNHISIAGGIANALKSVDLYLEQNKLQMGVEVVHCIIKQLQIKILILLECKFHF